MCFTDLSRLHMLDYDKKFLLSKSADNLTFDGSSIRGFSQRAESDLRLNVDWGSSTGCPPTSSGPGKVLVFGESAGSATAPRTTRTCAASSSASPKTLYQKRTEPSSTPRPRSKASCSRAAT